MQKIFLGEALRMCLFSCVRFIQSERANENSLQVLSIPRISIFPAHFLKRARDRQPW